MKTELPAKKTKRRPLNNPYIVDNLGVLICMCYDEEQADCIVEAINSHEKFKTALEKIADGDSYEPCTPIAKQALKEVEKPK